VAKGATENVVRTFPDVRQGPEGAHAQEVVDAAGVQTVSEETVLYQAVRKKRHQATCGVILSHGRICAVSGELCRPRSRNGAPEHLNSGPNVVGDDWVMVLRVLCCQ
jgi:hypothetical protein